MKEKLSIWMKGLQDISVVQQDVQISFQMNLLNASNFFPYINTTLFFWSNLYILKNYRSTNHFISLKIWFQQFWHQTFLRSYGLHDWLHWTVSYFFWLYLPMQWLFWHILMYCLKPSLRLGYDLLLQVVYWSRFYSILVSVDLGTAHYFLVCPLFHCPKFVNNVY